MRALLHLPSKTNSSSGSTTVFCIYLYHRLQYAESHFVVHWILLLGKRRDLFKISLYFLSKTMIICPRCSIIFVEGNLNNLRLQEIINWTKESTFLISSFCLPWQKFFLVLKHFILMLFKSFISSHKLIIHHVFSFFRSVFLTFIIWKPNNEV